MSELTKVEMIQAQLQQTWHSTGCATNVGAEDGGGYCTPGCAVYDSKAALQEFIKKQEELESELHKTLFGSRMPTKTYEYIVQLQDALRSLLQDHDAGLTFTASWESAREAIKAGERK